MYSSLFAVILARAARVLGNKFFVYFPLSLVHCFQVVMQKYLSNIVFLFICIVISTGISCSSSSVLGILSLEFGVVFPGCDI